MRSLTLLALAAAAAAQHRGFNYGSTNNDGSVRQEADFEAEFNRAKNLQGASGFTSARLYTMVQGGTSNGLTSAIPAAIGTETSLLLGLWASQDQDGFNNELSALSTAIKQYGSSLSSLIVGISVGSEDLYRISPTGIENKSGAGQSPDTLVSYINQVRNVIKGTAISGASVGHVDTWTAWVNGSNAAVIGAVDWLGMDGYPYFQTTEANGISVGSDLFFDSYNATVGVAQGKEVWITETGWPVQGPTANLAVASTENAETYWKAVACRVLGNINTWWYTLYDPAATSSDISFGLVGPNLDSAPLYDLSCGAGSTPSSSSVSAAPSSTTAPAGASHTSPVVVSSPVATHPVASTPVSNPPSSASSSPSSSAPAGACPTNLNGDFQFPHLIIPIDSAQPNTAFGTSYDGTITPTISSIFNFDIPSSYSGKTCSLVFLFPEQKDLTTSSFEFNNKGGFHVSYLSSPATEQTTYSNAPHPADGGVNIPSVAPGNSYVAYTNACGAGMRAAFEFASTGGLNLTYFQDDGPSPIGAYITVC